MNTSIYKLPILSLVIFYVFSNTVNAQIPANTLIAIVRAEDARRYDKTLEDLMTRPGPAVQVRAVLAAGRIGDEAALPPLALLLENSPSVDVRAMAAFAIGEIESIKGADAILKVITDQNTPDPVRARCVEAAGKIALANAKDTKAKDLSKAIVDTLGAQLAKVGKQNREVVLLALTAALRARPEGANTAVAPFLLNLDSRVRSDAANTLTRLRAKNANDTLRAMLKSDVDPTARANAARALGAAEDKDALELLITAATGDADSRVRVSAIRALASLKDAKAADPLLDRGKKLLGNYEYQKTENRSEKNECLEIAVTVGRLLAKTKNEKAIKFLNALSMWGEAHDAETAMAMASIDPKGFLDRGMPYIQDHHATAYDWRRTSAQAQALATLANSDDKDIRQAAAERIGQHVESDKTGSIELYLSIPEDLQALAAFKPADLADTLRGFLNHSDPLVRAAAAGGLADLPASKENVEALKSAFDMALVKDKEYNDAQLAMLDALYKLDKKEAVGTLLVALNAPDYLVRKKAFEMLDDKDLQKDFPGIPTSLEIARTKHKDQVLPYSSAFGTKLGQVLNNDADYRRAVSRKNGSVKAVLKTVRGTFTIDLMPEDAPLTVDNFIKLARLGYLNGIWVHRVVPNFVMQDGDPRGDGNGGPGWSVRCEVNMLTYDRGAVGMALSGKDTGGSQWFVTHSPQPHLDGGYTIFGHVSEADMKVVDTIVRGDQIVSVKIIESGSTTKTPGTQRTKK